MVAEMKEINFKTKKSNSENDVIEFYDEYASSWDERFGEEDSTKYFIERRWKSFEDAFFACGVEHGLGIELGVGTGVYIERASLLFDKIVAVDGSAGMLKELEKKITNATLTNITCMNANVIDLKNIQGNSADCVYFFGLIEHIVNLGEFIREVGRVLKKGGVVIGVTPNGRSPWYRLRKLVRGTGAHCSSDTYYLLSELDEQFCSAGFSTEYAQHWGAVPAGIGRPISKVLSTMEPYLENSFLKIYLGGITFAYRLL